MGYWQEEYELKLGVSFAKSHIRSDLLCLNKAREISILHARSTNSDMFGEEKTVFSPAVRILDKYMWRD